MEIQYRLANTMDIYKNDNSLILGTYLRPAANTANQKK